MNKKLLTAAFFVGAWGAYSQVGIGTLTPNPSTQLDIVSENKGVLFPRVNLISTTDATTITQGNVSSLFVYNTGNNNDIKPGYYYWYENKWMRIVNDADVVALDKNTTNQSLTVIGADLVLTDSDGNTVSVPLSAINIPTSIVKNPDGTYTFTNEAGATVTIDATDNVVTNIQNQGDIYTEIINILTQESDLFVDNGNGTFTHTSVDGTVVTFDANTTAMVDNGDGTYTFTNANGTTLTVDVVGDVVTNIQNQGAIYSEIINILTQESDTFVDNTDGTFTHTAVDGTVVTFDANTTTMVNNNNGTYTFTNANGTTLTVDVVGDVVTNIQNQGAIYSEIINILTQESDLFVDNGNGTFTHTSVDGTVVTFDANTTAMVDNGDGTYTFTNANGTTLTVDVVGDVVTNIQNQGAIYSEIINILTQESDLFVDNGNGTFTHTAVDGTVMTFDANTTAMVDNGDGTYTFTNANGTTLTVDVVGDVVTNIQNQGAIYSEIINILTQESDLFVDNGNGTFTHTAVDGTVVTFDANTTAMVDNGDGTYTFTNANGTTLTVDVVGDVVTNIQNQGAIYSEIINILTQESDLFVDNGNGTFTHTSVDGTVVTFDANTTAMVDNGDGTYTFTNANGTTLTVDVVGDVVTNIQNQGDIYSEIINILTQESDLFVDNGNGTFTHTAVDGTVVTFDANTTAMVDNGDGTYTFTNANGTTLTVDVVGDVVTNIQNQGDIYSEIINILTQESDLFVDNGNGTFTHTSVDGTVVTFDANTTAMVDNGDGTYTFTNANGTTLTVDVVGDVVTNIQNQGDIYSEIINILTQESDLFVDNGNGTFTHTSVDGTVVTFDANTTAMVDNGDGTYTFTNANGTTLTVDVVGDVVTNIQNQGDIYSEIINILTQESDLFVDNGNGTFTHTSVDGTVVTFDANTTAMVDNGDGTYTFTNANGTTLTVDVVGDVVTNIQNQGDIYSEIINILTQESDLFVDNGNGTFTHTAVDGTVVTFDANTTAMVDNGDGTYTFTNANGTTLTVDVVGDVVTNIQNQGDIYSEIINILTQESDLFVDNGNGTFTHTAVDGTVVTFDANTTAMVDNGDGTYTFTNANGTTLTVDVVGDVVTNIQNQGDIYSEIINILTQESDIFVDNGNGTFTHTAVDGTVVTFDANTTAMVDNGDGTYTFTNANGTTLTVDVVGDVVTNIQNQGAIYSEIINILTQESDLFVDNGNGTFTHTAVDGTVVTFDANTTAMVDNGDGTYTFTNANGTTLTVDVVGDVVTNIQNQGDIYSEIINILTQESDLFVDNGNGTFTHTSVDGTVVTFDANTTAMVDNGDGTYTFTNANGTTLTVDVVGDVVTNIQNQGDIYSEIINILTQESDLFVDNGNGTFTHTSVDGTVVTFDANTTAMVDNGDGTYTFTNANGTTLTVDVVGDVVTNIQNQGAIYSEIINILTQESDIFVDNGNGTFTHTAVDGTVVTFDANTTAMVDNGDGTYTFTNANGTTLTVDVVGDVVTNIQNQGAIYSEIINILTQESDIFVDNGNGTFTHTAVDGTVVTFDANTTAMVDNGDGTYTFTNANGTTLTVDVVGDVVTNIQNQGDIYSEIINILTQESDLFVDNGNGTFTHTSVDGEVITFDANTTAMLDNGNGTYTFTNKNGSVLTVDVVGDVVTNIQNQGAIYSEIINILEQESDIFTDNGNGTFTHTSVDGEVITFDANTTSVTEANGVYTFKDGAGATITTIDTNTNNELTLVGNELTSTVNGKASSVNLTDANITSAKTITSNSINLTGQNGATLKDVMMEIKPGSANQVLVTNASGNGTTWVNQSVISPTTTNELTSSGNTITSNVNGVSDDATIINAVENSLGVDNRLITTVNGVPSTGIDLTPAIQANQNNTVVAQGAGITVTPSTSGKTTTYTVAANPAGITLNGDVTGAANATKVVKIQGTSVSATAPSTTGHALVYNSTSNQWEPGIPKIDAGNVTDRKDLTPTTGDNSITVTNGTGTTLINTQLHVTDGGITNDKLGTDAVTNDKLADNAVSTENIVDGTVASDDLANNAVTTAKIADANVTAAKLTAGAGTPNRVAIADATGAVTYTDALPSSSVDGENVTAGSNKVTLGGTPQGAALKAFSVDVAEANLTLSNMGGKVTNDQITPGTAGQVLVTNGTTTSWQNPVDNNTTYSGSTSIALEANNSFQREALTGDVTAAKNSNVTTIAPNAVTEGKIATDAVTARTINPDVAGTGLKQATNGALEVDQTALATGTLSSVANTGAITVTGGNNATFKDVTLAVKAESGVEIHDDKVKLGGDLKRATTITQAGNAFTIATGGSNLNITGLDKTTVQATHATNGITDRLLAVGTDDKVKALKAAMPKFFYMPSVMVPTAESHLGQPGVTYNNGTRTGTIQLYDIYKTQFGTPVKSSAGASPLPVLPASELGFHVTYASQGFTIEGITQDGLMTYKVDSNADIHIGSFINIVFSVNED